MSTPSDDLTLPGSRPPRRRRRPRRLVLGIGVGIAALVLMGAGVGAGMALAPNAAAVSAGPAAAGAGHGAKKAHGGRVQAAGKVDPARQAWAQQFGVDRATMPDLAPAAAATPQQHTAATDLLVRTEQTTARYADPNMAKAAGYDVAASLAKHQQKKGPKLAQQMQAIDAGTAGPGTPMPMLHVANQANKADGKVLDPTAPETLMYGYQGHGAWRLMGVMYTANESFPRPPPDPGGPIMRWHYHDKSGGQKLMMHLFFVPGNDLAHGYAADMKS